MSRFRQLAGALSTVLAVGAASSVNEGCAPSETSAASTSPASNESGEPAESKSEHDGRTNGETPDASTYDPPSETPPKTPTLDVVLSGRPIQAFAIGETHVFTLESDTRSRLVATSKTPPHAVKVLLEEDIIDGVRFEGVGASRGRVFIVDTYGAARSARPDGTDVSHEDVVGGPTRILSAPNTLWYAAPPQFLGDILTFSWSGPNPSAVPFAQRQLVPTGTVADVASDDEALVYTTRGATFALRSWAPAAAGARGGHRLVTSLPEESRGLAIDSQRAYAYLPTAKAIRSYDRTTGAATDVLSAFTFDTTPVLRSDGTSLYALTQTALRRCTIANCSATMTLLASGIASARSLVVDGTHAWIVMASDNAPGKIARVPK